MNIRIPQRMVNAWVAFGDWADVWVWQNGRVQVLRIDILMVILFLFCAGFYWAAYGWQGALQGGFMFIAIAALALFMRRPDTTS